MARVARARVAVSDRAVGRDQRTCVKGPGLPNVGISRSDRWPLQPACLFTPRQVGGDRAHRALELARLQLLAQVEGEARLGSIRTGSSLRLRFTGQCWPLGNAGGDRRWGVRWTWPSSLTWSSKPQSAREAVHT